MSLIKVVKAVGSKKDLGIEFQKTANDFTVARLLNAETNQVEGFANMVQGSQKTIIEVNKKLTDIEPMFPISNEGLGVIISGEQGTGKSTLSALFLKQYEQMYPNNRMFFVSQKSKYIDRNLGPITKLFQMGDDLINNFNIEDYKDSIFLIDDSDFGKNVNAVMEMLNLISTVGREYNISWIFVTHYNSRLNKTKAYTEYKVYITFNDNLNNNRMLMVHMGLNKQQIEYLVKMSSSFYMFSKIFNTLITDSMITKLSKVREPKPLKTVKAKPEKKEEQFQELDLEAYKQGILRRQTRKI